LGWLQADAEVIQRLVNSGLLDSGGGMNPFTSAIVYQVLETGNLERNIAKLITTYRARISIMDAAMREYLPSVEYSFPQGGYFFWIHLPSKVNSIELQRRAEAFKVGIRPGRLFSCRGGMMDYMRLSFVFYEPDELEQGILRLKQSMDLIEY
jgi:DNA-binding transcriptional MocR family regulator